MFEYPWRGHRNEQELVAGLVIPMLRANAVIRSNNDGAWWWLVVAMKYVKLTQLLNQAKPLSTKGCWLLTGVGGRKVAGPY